MMITLVQLYPNSLITFDTADMRVAVAHLPNFEMLREDWWSRVCVVMSISKNLLNGTYEKWKHYEKLWAETSPLSTQSIESCG